MHRFHRTPSFAVALVLGILLLPLAPRAAAAIDVRDAITRFMASDSLESEWFAPSFLAAVPFDQLEPLRKQLTGSVGAFEEVRADGDRWMAVFETVMIPVYASIDSEGRFDGLRLLPPVPRASSLEELAASFAELPGRGGFLVTVDGTERLAVEPDTPFAVGSAFKLVVLRALVDAIENGDFEWSDVVQLTVEKRTLATGTLSTWPDGAPLTLATLASWMISESDNTATDVLMHALGRERIEAADPSARNRPFLTTAEFFRLKNPENQSLLLRWRGADEAGRREVLEEMAAAPLPSPSLFAGDPVSTDVEWFFTVRELCGLIDGLGDFDLMGINPGVVSAGAFDRVAYKGGSEPGVLNFTTWTLSKSGTTICVCATRNADVPLELSDVSGVVSGAFDVLREID